MDLRIQFHLTKRSCLLVPAFQNIVLGVSEISSLAASLVLALRANAPACREGGGAGCCLQSENHGELDPLPLVENRCCEQWQAGGCPRPPLAAEARVQADTSVPPASARSHAGLCSAPSLAPFTHSSLLWLLFVHKPVPASCRRWSHQEVTERYLFLAKPGRAVLAHVHKGFVKQKVPGPGLGAAVLWIWGTVSCRIHPSWCSLFLCLITFILKKKGPLFPIQICLLPASRGCCL